MHQEYKLHKATPLKLMIKTNESIGISRKDGCEQIPNTPTVQDALGIKVMKPTAVNIPFNTMDEGTKDKFNMLREYQQEDCKFLSFRKAAGVFNEQRTGKTPTSLISLRIKKCRKILIVCPSSMVLPWAQEFEFWMDRPCIPLTGTAQVRKKKLEQWTDGLVIGYESLRMVDRYRTDEETGEREYSHSTGELVDILHHPDIDAVIIDEAHRIRNYKTKTAQAIYKLHKIPNKLALTGTPTLNKQEEIYSIYKFLYPTLFSSYWKFIDYYFNKETKTVYLGGRPKDYQEVGSLKKPKELQEFMDFTSTQRKRKEVMPWLPEKERETILFPLDKDQKKHIERLREYFETEHVITQGVLDTLIRERQICNAPSLLTLSGSSPKLDWIKQYVKDYPDKQVIMFSKFTTWLEFINKELPDARILAGSTSLEERDRLKKAFQSGDLKLLLIQIDAGKEGLTLDKADTIIFTDKFPPVGDIEQAEDRLVATTKDKVKSGQVIYTLAMKDTYEEIIIQALDKRASELDVINNYRKYLERR